MLTNPSPRRPSSPPSGPLRRSGAANDNRRFRVIVPTSPGRLARLGRNVLKLNPYFRLAGMGLDVLELFQQAQAEGFDNLGPWRPYCYCPTPNPVYTGPIVRIGSGAAGSNNGSIRGWVEGCLGNQAFSAGTQNDPWLGVGTGIRSISTGKSGTVIFPNRAQHQVGYTRPSTGAFTKPTYRPAANAIALPAVRPSQWPLTVWPELAAPNQAPAFTPPRPWGATTGRSLNSAASYGGLTERYIVAPSKQPSQVPNDWAVAVETGPVSGRAAPKTHTLAPPLGAPPGAQPREKELKIKLSPAFVGFLKFASMSTESIDTINAIYLALPEQYRPKFRNTDYELRSATIPQKMRALIEHADKIDLQQAIENLIFEQAEDYVYGKIGKAGGAVSKQLGLNYGTGVNSIMSRLRKSTYDIERNNELDEFFDQ